MPVTDGRDPVQCPFNAGAVIRVKFTDRLCDRLDIFIGDLFFAEEGFLLDKTSSR